MGGGERRGHRRHRHNHHHNRHRQNHFGGVLFVGAGQQRHPMQRRMMSIIFVFLCGIGFLFFGFLSAFIFGGSSNPQGMFYFVFGAILILFSLGGALKLYTMLKQARTLDQGAGSADSAATTMQYNTQSQVHLQQQQTGGIWTTDQSGMSPPPSYGVAMQTPMGYSPQAIPLQPLNGSRAWAVQQPNPTTNQISAPSPAQGPGYVEVQPLPEADILPPSYEEAVKPQQIP